MSDVVPLRRSGGCTWQPDSGAVRPVHTSSELQALVAGWLDYGATATVFSAAPADRAAVVTSLGDDGWLLRVRDGSMRRFGWNYSMTVTRTSDQRSRWYMPSERSDLRGSILLDVDIQFAPHQIAKPAWAWLAADPLPDAFELGKESYDHVAVATIADAFDTIGSVGRPVWTAEEAAAVIGICSTLDVDRVVLRGPRSIVARVADTGQRVYFVRRRDEDGVRVSGLTDELGRTYTMKLPSREIVRVHKGRP